MPGVQRLSAFFVVENPFSVLYVIWILFIYCNLASYLAFFNNIHTFFNMWACYLQNSVFHKTFQLFCEIICKLTIRRSKSCSYYFSCYQKVVGILNSLLKICNDCKSNCEKWNIYFIWCHPEGHVIRKFNNIFCLSRANEFVYISNYSVLYPLYFLFLRFFYCVLCMKCFNE